MSDDPKRPEDEERPSWAPFGMDEESPPPEKPLWSGDDPVSAEPPRFEPPKPPPISDLGWPAAAQPPPPLPPPSPRPEPAGTWPAPGAPAAAPRTSGNAQASLVLGAIGIFVCPIICSVAAIVLAVRARHEIDAGAGAIGGRGAATAGLVLGVIGLLWFVVILAVGFGGALGPVL